MPLKDLFTRKKSDKSAGGSKGGDPVTALFEKYKEADEDKIGPEGIMNLCSDMHIEPSDVKLMILAWKLNAEQQGYFTRGEWCNGLEDMRVDSAPLLLAKLDSYEKELWGNTRSPKFKDFYKFAFRFSRTAGQKTLEIDTVKALLPIVTPEGHPHVEGLLGYLEATPSVRGFNEDQWSSFLLFSHEVSTDFSNFDENGAWPSVLDEFVEWGKK